MPKKIIIIYLEKGVITRIVYIKVTELKMAKKSFSSELKWLSKTCTYKEHLHCRHIALL